MDGDEDRGGRGEDAGADDSTDANREDVLASIVVTFLAQRQTL